jgi:hypothetical protein
MPGRDLERKTCVEAFALFAVLLLLKSDAFPKSDSETLERMARYSISQKSSEDNTGKR